MRITPALALGMMLPLGGAVMLAGPAVAAKKEKEAAAPQLKPSPEFVKVYQEIDKLLKANDYAGAKAKLPQAEAAAKNQDDQFLVGTLALNTGLGLKDEPQQRQALDKMLASGKAGADTGKFEYFAGQFALKAKDFDGAIRHLTASQQAGYTGGEPAVMIAESYFGKATQPQNVAGNQLNPTGKQLAIQGLPYLKQGIDAKKASGQPVPPEWISRGFKMAALSQSPDMPQWSQLALAGGGGPAGAASQGENWRITLRTFQDGHKTLTRDENLDVLRLMAATGALKDAYSYGEYIDAASRGGLLGETKAIIDKGRAAGNLQPAQFAQTYSQASGGAAADRASLGAAEASATKAATGKLAAATGNAYLGYGDYAKAAQLYRLALQKGGVDTNEVNTRLGIALAQSGDTVGAKAAFGSVTTGARKEIASLWITWLDSKGAPAA